VDRDKQFHRFGVAGIVNTIFFYALYALLIFLSLPYYAAIIGANSVGIFFSFKNFGHHVFGLHHNSLLWRFVIGYGFLISFYTLVVYLFRLTGMNDYVAGLAALVPHVPLAFIVNKKFVYISRK